MGHLMVEMHQTPNEKRVRTNEFSEHCIFYDNSPYLNKLTSNLQYKIIRYVKFNE